MAILNPIQTFWTVAKDALARLNLALSDSAHDEDLVFRIHNSRSAGQPKPAEREGPIYEKSAVKRRAAL